MMNSETKMFVGIIGVSVAILIGAVFFLSRPTPPKQATKVDASLLVRADSQKLASASATVTLVEFGDYQCPACATYHPLVKQLLNEFKNDVAFVFRHFPLEQIHKNARISAQAAEAAGMQGKFWEMHNYLYEHQREWSDSGKVKELFGEYAKNIGIDVQKFTKDLDSSVVKEKIDEDVKDAEALVVNATPTFYLDAEKLEIPGGIEDFRALIKAAIEKAPKPSIAPTEEYHTHFNLKVYVDGKPLDLTVPKYQSPEGKELDPYVHLHDGNGDVVHIHKKGVTVGDLFTSFGQSIDTCFVADTGEKYCNYAAFVNGNAMERIDQYVPQDLDRILISFGHRSGEGIDRQKSSVADTACIYSEKCPERGKPPTENCVGGLGTGCKQ